MRILIVDNQGSALDWALRCLTEGHVIKWFIRDQRYRPVGKGLVDHVEDYRPWLRWADLVFVTDNTFYMRDLDFARRDGAMVFGATQASAEWELDRQFGAKVLKQAGILTPPTREFRDYDRAIAEVKRTMKRYVSKVSGSDDKALSYCSKGPADMVFMLERWKKLNKLKGDFILQEFIPGTEMAVGAFIGPAGFASGWCENWEFKKLMNDDLGVATGEQGTVVRFTKTSKLAQKVLLPLEDRLVATGHSGYVDVNCIIDEDGTPWPLEFTMRPGWPTFQIQQALFTGKDHAQWMLDILSGRDPRTWAMDQVALGVVLSIPDYPYSHLTKKETSGIPLYGLKPADMPNVHPCEMALGEAPVDVKGKIVTCPCLVTAGDYVAVVSGTAETVRDAKLSAYRRVKRLSLPNSPMYRTDIGNRLSKQLPDLHRHGYATNLEWTRAAS